MRGETVSGTVKTTGQMLIRSGITCLLLGVVQLGLGADAKKAAEAKVEVESPEKALERLRVLIGFTGQSNVVAADVKVCPDGHKTLKNVPILYGTPSPEPKHQKARETAVERFAYRPGGCEVGSDSATNRVTCTTSGLGFDSELDSWSGYRQAPTQFSRPFTAPILSFPIPATNSLFSGTTYYQSLRKGRVQNESLSYTSTDPASDLIKRVDDWFRSRGVSATKHVRGNTTGGPTTELVQWREGTLSVLLNQFGPDKTTAIHIHNSRDLAP